MRTVTEFDRELGSKVREVRLANGMSQSDLAGKLGLTFQQVQKYEKGANRISAGRLLEIGRVLEFDFSVATSPSGGGVMETQCAELTHRFLRLDGAKQKLVLELVRQLG